MEISDLEQVGKIVQEDNGGDADLTTEVRLLTFFCLTGASWLVVGGRGDR